MMRKAMIAGGVASLLLCGQTSGCNPDSSGVNAFVQAVQADAKALCAFEPVAAGILAIVSGATGSLDAQAIASMICNGTPTKSLVAGVNAGAGARVVEIGGKRITIEGVYVH